MNLAENAPLIIYVTFITWCLCDARNLGKFWHVTDLHFDDRYSVFGNPEFMCWEVGDALTDNSVPLGKYGDYNCDSPQSLIESAVEAMKKFLPNPDFILWTGDDTTHVNDSYFSTDIVVNVIANLTNELRKGFPETPFLPVLGNHDLYPQNQIGPGQSELQTRVAILWKDWLDEFGVYQEFKDNGRYVADLKNSKVSVMGLNTLLWYESNKITKDDPSASDPGRQFLWADQQLEALTARGRKVYLMGHIPPGMFERYFEKQEGFHWYQPRYNRQYINLVQKYGSTIIVAQFFGHHHTDSFRVFLANDPVETPVSFALIAPGVTPMKSTLSEETGANNPGLRLITYDRDTGEIIESTTYYLDLEAANINNEANWVFEYNLTEILNLDKINAETLYKATGRLSFDSKLFDLYYTVNTVKYDNATGCSPRCHLTQLCAMTNIDYDEFYDCNGAFKPIYGAVAFFIGFMFLTCQKTINRLL